MVWHAIDLNCLGTANSIDSSTAESSNTPSIRGWTQMRSPILYGSSILCRLSGIWSITFIHCSYLYITLAGTVNPVMSSLGVALYQYTASWIEHHILAAILLTVQCHHSAIPLPSGVYVPLYLICTPHLAAKSQKSWPQKIGSLSANILMGGSCLQKTALSCYIIDYASCHASKCHTVKCIGPQSIKDRKWLWIVMSHIQA